MGFITLLTALSTGVFSPGGGFGGFFESLALLSGTLSSSTAAKYVASANAVWLSGYVLFFSAMTVIISVGFKYLDTAKFRMLRTFYINPLSPAYVFIFDTLFSLAFFLGGWLPLTYINIHNFKKKEILFISLCLAVTIVPFFIMATFPSFFDGLAAGSPVKILESYDKWEKDGVFKQIPYDETAKKFALTHYLRAEYLKAEPSSGKTRYGLAAASIESAMEAGLQHPSVYNSYGNAMLLSGNAKKALYSYNEALRKRPEDPVILFNISQYYLYIDDYNSARTYYDKAFSLKGELELPVLDWDNIVLLEMRLPPGAALSSVYKNMMTVKFREKAFSIKKMVLIPSVILLLFVSILLLAPFTGYWASFVKCDSCGDPIIAGGASTARKGVILCAACNFMLPDTRGPGSRPRKDIPGRMKNFKSLMINLVFPGCGYILRGRIVSGFFWILLTAVFLMTALYAGNFMLVSARTVNALRKAALFYPLISLLSSVLLLFIPQRRAG